MIKIDYPPYQPKIKTQETKEYIFDEVRKQWVLLTPEEWVRQNFLQYLMLVKNYPASLIAVEKEIQLGELKKRFDILLYDKNTRPLMMVECKEMNVAIDEKVMQQALRYNISLQVQYIIMTNGQHCFAFATAGGKLSELTEIPSY